uniref:Uncharacterized protein n=1 Tax=Rhizophora mucronata TaxID=61149 RepID=A0A2P2J4C7_RHIMU
MKVNALKQHTEEKKVPKTWKLASHKVLNGLVTAKLKYFLDLHYNLT